MPMNSEARKPSANRMMTATSSTPVTTEFCRSASIWRMTFDLSCVKVTCDGLRPGLSAAAPTTCFTPSTVSIRLAPVRFDTSMVIAGVPLTRVIEVASLKVGLTCGDVAERHRRAGGRGDRNLQHVLRLLDQRRAPSRRSGRSAPSSAPAATRLLDGVVTPTELIERDAVALHQHRLDDDLDRLVARAAQLGRQHAGHLLDRVLGGARDAQQRALGHVARQSATTSTG